MNDWRDQAACHPDRRPEGMSRAEWTAIFFPERGQRVSEATQVCAACPVRVDCLSYAQGFPLERDGIWGGTTGRQRRRQRRVAKPASRRYSYREMRLAVDLHARGDSIASISRRIGADRRTIENWIDTDVRAAG